jgi:hypothetical protein
MLDVFVGGLSQTMSGRHSLAIGMLVWYLLTPPYVGPQKFDAKAPLSKWYEAVDFDSLSDCQRYRAGTIKQYQERLREDPSGSRANVELFKESQCVSSEDPRRTGN